MNLFPSIIPARPRVRRMPERRAGAGAVAPVALVLVAAEYDPDGPEVYLTFDRAIKVSGIVVVKFSIADGGNGYHWVGFEAPVVVSPTEVSVSLAQGSPYLESDTTLSVLSGNGVVAVDDGGGWVGVVGLAVPYP